jgi:hypothetical protein
MRDKHAYLGAHEGGPDEVEQQRLTAQNRIIEDSENVVTFLE